MFVQQEFKLVLISSAKCVIECADAAHGLGAHIIADGGCTCPGDVAKGFGGGADFVMLGGMFAGHDEGGGKILKSNGSNLLNFMVQVLKQLIKNIMVDCLLIEVVKVDLLELNIEEK